MPEGKGAWNSQSPTTTKKGLSISDLPVQSSGNKDKKRFEEDELKATNLKFANLDGVDAVESKNLLSSSSNKKLLAHSIFKKLQLLRQKLLVLSLSKKLQLFRQKLLVLSIFKKLPPFRQKLLVLSFLKKLQPILQKLLALLLIKKLLLIKQKLLVHSFV
jgi:hypothetical protein